MYITDDKNLNKQLFQQILKKYIYIIWTIN